jgi:prophage maintenance system killer protein
LDEPLYPTFDEVVRAHNEIVEDGRIPASLPLHPDKLASAINRPRHHAFYVPGTDLASLTAIMAAAISQSQAFEDGNKRTALAAADALLGLELVAELDFMARNGEREAVIELFAEWLRWNVAPLDAEGSVSVD